MGLLQAAPLIYNDPYTLRYYSTDASGHTIRPHEVAIPQDAHDVADVVRGAVQTNIGITARGAGTGLVGGAVGNGTILDTIRLDKTSYHDGMLCSGPGTRMGVVNQLLQKHGRILGPDPSVGPYCSVGGMVATNASGGLSMRYGSVIDNLESIAMVDGRGEMVRLPHDKHISDMVYSICRRAEPFPCIAKNSCGYRMDMVSGPDMAHKIIAASEGTLGIITEVQLHTHPAPQRRVAIILEYENGRSAAADCMDVAKCGPAALEIAGPGIVEGYEESCTLFAEFHHDMYEDDIDHTYDMVQEAAAGCISMKADDGTWRAKRAAALSKSLRVAGDGFPSVIEDATVPLAELPKLFDMIQDLGAESGLAPTYYGHAGSGNIHVRAPVSRGMARQYLREVIGMGGTITGEHGDGIGRADMVQEQYGNTNYELFGELKEMFDPYNILNPGKVLGAPWRT